MKTYVFRCRFNGARSVGGGGETVEIRRPDDSSAIAEARARLARCPAGQAAELISPDGRMIWMDEAGLDPPKEKAADPKAGR